MSNRKEVLRLVKLARALDGERGRAMRKHRTAYDPVIARLRDDAKWWLLRDVENWLDDIERRRAARDAEQRP